MLSYQHEYHAGNHADVLKHWLLIECVQHLQKKDKPFDYIDTHAGAGLYDLNSKEARKTGESDHGVNKFDLAEQPGLEAYHQLVSEHLGQQRYPGSPMLVKQQLRQGDRAWLFEMHPQTITKLEQSCAKRRSCMVHKEDGFKGLLRLLPTPSRRPLVLIDPSYEIKSDYQTVVKVMSQAYKKTPQAMLLLWYPMVHRATIDQLERDIQDSNMRDVHLFELAVDEDHQQGMTASGIIAVNPPWTLAERFKQVMPAVSEQLAVDGVSRCRYERLVAE